MKNKASEKKTANTPRPGNFGIGIHGGASADTAFIRKNLKAYEESLAFICNTGFELLKKRTSAMDTVFAVLELCENDPLFNSGRGSSLNEEGRVHMDAAVMNGKDLSAGAVAMVEGVKNPSALVREVLKHTNHIFLGGEGAMRLAATKNLELMPESYFITTHQVDNFLRYGPHETLQDKLRKKMKGTNGVVVVDHWGNLAAGSTTGGTANALAGRIGDTCVLGAGCYANNETCAITATGDGEFIIQGVVAHHVSCVMEMKGESIQNACDYVVHKKNGKIKGDLGVIGIDRKGNIGIAFNTERMHRAWMTSKQDLQVKIYR
jgi:beta-aspartyl-peptidase (threonine type)